MREDPADRFNLQLWAMRHGWLTFEISFVCLRHEMKARRDPQTIVQQSGIHLNASYHVFVDEIHETIRFYQDPQALQRFPLTMDNSARIFPAGKQEDSQNFLT